MHISWLGNTALRIQSKPLNEEVVVAIDAYKSKQGSMPRSMTPQVAAYTRTEKDSVTMSGDPFVLSTPGECDVKGVLVTAVEGSDEKNTMLRVDTEHMSLGHLGLTNKQLTNRQNEVLSGVDILCVPVGHEDAYSAEQAVKIVNELEPRIVIPMAFKSDVDPKAKTADAFIKELGMAGKVQPEKKVIIKKKDLPQEETQVILLSKE